MSIDYDCIECGRPVTVTAAELLDRYGDADFPSCVKCAACSDSGEVKMFYRWDGKGSI